MLPCAKRHVRDLCPHSLQIEQRCGRFLRERPTEPLRCGLRSPRLESLKEGEGCLRGMSMSAGRAREGVAARVARGVSRRAWGRGLRARCGPPANFAVGVHVAVAFDCTACKIRRGGGAPLL